VTGLEYKFSGIGFAIPGIEVAAELSDLAQRELKDLYPTVAPLLSITISDIASQILGTYARSCANMQQAHVAAWCPYQ
jgi:NADH dehydrogenase FAD-containing subunit